MLRPKTEAAGGSHCTMTCEEALARAREVSDGPRGMLFIPNGAEA